MVRDSIDNIWIATQAKGINYFDGTLLDTINSGLTSRAIYGLCYDNKKTLYAITKSNLFRYDAKVWVNCLSINDITFHSDAFTSLAADNKGNLWLGTASRYCYKWDGKEVKKYSPFNWAHPLNPLSIGIDAKGRCWAGNWAGYGLKDTMIYFNGKKWQKLSLSDAYTAFDTLSFNKICDMDSLKIWADSQCALVYIKNNTTTDPYFEWCCYTIGNRYGHGSNVKRDRKGTYWYAAPYGLWRFNGQGEYLFTKCNSSLPGEYIGKIAIDSSDKLWLSVRNKRINGDTSWIVTFVDNSFSIVRTCDQNYSIADIEIDHHGNIWFAETYSQAAGIECGHGIFKLGKNSLTNYTISNSSLSSNTVFDLSLGSNKTLWITTYGAGIDTVCLSDNKWGYFTVENSHIADNDITQIEFDTKGNKWFKSHQGGLTIYRKGGINFQTSIKHMLDTKKTVKKIVSLYIENSKLYFKTQSLLSACISVYSVSGRRIAFIDNDVYASGMHCIGLNSDYISQSLLIVQIASGKERYHFKVFNMSR